MPLRQSRLANRGDVFSCAERRCAHGRSDEPEDEPEPRPRVVDRAHLVVDQAVRETELAHDAFA